MASIHSMTPEVIAARLEYKRPTPEQVATMNRLNEEHIVPLGKAIGELPEGLMKSTAVSDLVKLRMVINAAVIGDGIPAGTLAK
jgi:hypothetical protein